MTMTHEYFTFIGYSFGVIVSMILFIALRPDSESCLIIVMGTMLVSLFLTLIKLLKDETLL